MNLLDELAENSYKGVSFIDENGRQSYRVERLTIPDRGDPVMPENSYHIDVDPILNLGENLIFDIWAEIAKQKIPEFTIDNWVDAMIEIAKERTK